MAAYWLKHEKEIEELKLEIKKLKLAIVELKVGGVKEKEKET